MLYIDQALCTQESIREECELGKWVADRLLGRI